MNLSLAVESQNLMTNTRRSSRLDLMEMTKQIESCTAASIIQLALRQNSKDRTLTSIHIAKHRQTQVNELQSRNNNNNTHTTVLLLFWNMSGTTRMS